MNLKRFAMLGVVVLLGTLSGWSCAHMGEDKKNNGGSKGSAFQQPCADFCQRLQALKCQEGEPLADGTSCETFCINTQEAGHDLKISCILQIQSCAELQRCR